MNGSNFRAWRTAFGLSLTEAACVLGMSRRTICRYQSGDSPVPEPVAKLCNILLAYKAVLSLAAAWCGPPGPGPAEMTKIPMDFDAFIASLPVVGGAGGGSAAYPASRDDFAG